MDEVLVSLTHYNRPANIPRIINAFRRQTAKVHVALVECSDYGMLPKEVLDMADSVWTLRSTAGPLACLIPGLMMPEYKYAYLACDDEEPGCRVVQYMLETARQLRDDFACLAQSGKILVERKVVGSQRVAMGMLPVQVDYTHGSCFIQTKFILSALKFRNTMLEDHGVAMPRFEYHMLLNFGIQLAMRSILLTGASYLTPAPKIDEWLCASRSLQAAHALSGRDDARKQRDQFLEMAFMSGWRSTIPREVAT